MGDCGRSMKFESCATSVADDMSVARDIARRFEQLETQWLSFQKKSAKWEVEKDSLQKERTGLPRKQKHLVSSAASSYSNPLFTNHTSVKSSQLGDRASAASSRTGSPYAAPGLISDRTPFSLRQRKPAAGVSSTKDVTVTKDDNSSSQVSPPATQKTISSSSMPSSPLRTSAKASKDGRISPSSASMYTRATVPTFYRDKPPLRPATPAISKLSQGREKTVNGAFATRLSSQRISEPGRDQRTVFNLQGNLGQNFLEHESSSEAKFSSKEYSSNSGAMVESPLSPSYSASSDPATYSSGKGPPVSNIPSLEHLMLSDAAHGDQSRSPPSAPSTTTADADLHLNPSPYKAALQRNVSWRVLSDRGVLSEGILRQKTQLSKIDLEDDNHLSHEMPTYGAIDLTSKKGNVLKLELEIEKDDVDTDNEKLGDRLGRVNWELRLSKREAALGIAEEKFLEEQQKLSEAQLAVKIREDALNQREQVGKEEIEWQKNGMAHSMKSVETGKTVMKKLCAALKDVLWQLEQKDKVLQNIWLELRDSVDSGSLFGDHSFSFEPEMSQNDRSSATFDGISLLAAEGKCEEWCSTVIGICERLVSFMGRETHLQKWAIMLEGEGMRMAKMEKEMAKAKEAASEQCARAEAMMVCAEEQASSLEEERLKLAKERDNLILWVTHLQERRKAVAECEKEAATSLAEVQKKAADLFLHESNIDGRALEITALQEELRVTSQRLHDDQELMNREKHKVQEKLRQVAAREREADSKLAVRKKLQEELNLKVEKLEKDKLVEEKKVEKLLLKLIETEGRLSTKEMSLHELEKQLGHKGAAAEEMINNLNERENLLNGLQRQLEQERSDIQELIAGLERDKVRSQEAEHAIAEAHMSKQNAEEAWVRTAKERRESAEYLKSVEVRVKQWEDRLRIKEKELQLEQKNLQEIETRAREEQKHSEALHAKLVQEQQSWTLDLKAKNKSIAKRYKSLEFKEKEINSDLERLTEERRLALEEINRLAEMEARAWEAEKDLQIKHDEHLKEVRKHAKEYNAQVEDLELARREVEREFEEVHAKKKELQIWQREAEITMQNRIESFIKGKEELTAQIQELKKLQMDIEQAGSEIIDRVAELDQASTRLERQRHKVETSKSKLEGLADKLATHQEVLKQRENEFLGQESKLVAVQSGLQRMAADAAAKEKSLRFREQAVIDSENDLHELECRLANERKDLEKMIAEVEQHAAKLKEETAIVEESSRNRTRDENLIEEKRDRIQAKERELADFEADLKKKAKCLEEHGQTISKLEMQVKERLLRVADLETRSSELEKEWEKLKEAQANLGSEKESFAKAKTEIQRVAANQRLECLQWQVDQEQRVKDDIERKERLKEEMEKQRIEMMDILHAREAAIDAREANASERELALLKLEQQTKERKDQVENDAQDLRQQLQGARAELEDQRRHVEEKRKAADSIAVKVEEREERLKLKERDLERRGMVSLDRQSSGIERPNTFATSNEGQGQRSSDYILQTQMLGFRVSGVEDSVQSEVGSWVGKSDKGSAWPGSESGSNELRFQSPLSSRKQEQDAKDELVKQMEETFQVEAAKISQERAQLKLQQDDLEVTRRAVQEVKVTLTAQLKATKQMVADASLTAQNASRERESLEEERKRIDKAQKDAEASVLAKEAKLAVEAKQLESMKSMLEQEKAQAIEMIQQAAKRAADTEHAKAGSNLNAQWERIMMHKESQCDANLKERERELNSDVEAIRREKTSLTEERAQVKILHDALEREQADHSHVSLKRAVKADALMKDAENRLAWEEIRRRREKARLIEEAHGWHSKSAMYSEERINVAEQEFAFSTMKGGFKTGSFGCGLNEGHSRNMQDYHRHIDHNSNNCWDEPCGTTMLISSPTSSMTASTQVAPEKMISDSSCAQIYDGNSPPSRKTLENVMTSLMHARQASRSRLQRTENALLAFPPSAGFTTQVQQALDALTARLTLMEQIEEGLASHLQNAFDTESRGSDGAVVDKVQLLCRMEEQQSLRAEWEEDMQQQLETISMLQASSRNPSDFNTPMKMSIQGVPCNNDWQNHDNGIILGGEGHNSYELGRNDGNFVEGPNPDHDRSGGSRPPKSFSSPDWSTTFEPSQGAESRGLSYSPLVGYNYINSPGNQHLPEFRVHEAESHERNTRRKLQLFPPQVKYS